MPHDGPDVTPEISDAEVDYLCAFASTYFATPVEREDIVWTYSGVRSLHDDGSDRAASVTRDYVLSLDTARGAPAMHIFGGKITTYRRLAQSAVDKIGAALGRHEPHWTRAAPLPGGDFPVDGVAGLVAGLQAKHGFLDDAWAARLVRAYGTDAMAMLDGARTADDLGPAFGATITARELDWAMDREWVRSAGDFLWRRTKLGLKLTDDERRAVGDYIARRLAG